MESDDKNCDSLFTKTISKSNKPLIGLEYIIEFNDSQNVLRQFYCALCDMHCNEQELLFNLTTHEHRIKYLSRAVLMAIRNMNVDVEVVTLNLGTGEHKSAEFAKINPRMCVPTIVDDGFVLCESKAILMYLPHKMGMCKGRAFYPKCARQRALVHQRLLFDSVDFYSNISDLVNLSFSDEPILTVKHKAAIVGALNVMETQFLNGGDFFVGNSATIADFGFCSSVAALIAIGFNINDDYPKLSEWYERMGTLKGFNELSAGAQQTGAMVRKGLKNSFDDL